MLARLRTLWLWNRGLIQGSGKNFSLPGWHCSLPSFWHSEKLGPLSGVQSARIWSWQYTSILCPNQECVEKYLHYILWKLAIISDRNGWKILKKTLFGEHDEWQVLSKSIESLKYESRLRDLFTSFGLCLYHIKTENKTITSQTSWDFGFSQRKLSVLQPKSW